PRGHARTHGRARSGGRSRARRDRQSRGAVFDDGRVVDGPATEVISLAGRLDDSAAGPLTCTLITARGTVESGRLAPEGNIVGATYDLLLTGPAAASATP